MNRTHGRLLEIHLPQSNQRGIETGPNASIFFRMAATRLNRTSVGLKRVREFPWFRSCQTASIEPAWD